MARGGRHYEGHVDLTAGAAGSNNGRPDFFLHRIGDAVRVQVLAVPFRGGPKSVRPATKLLTILSTHQLRDLPESLHSSKLTFYEEQPARDPAQFHVAAVLLIHSSTFLFHHRQRRFDRIGGKKGQTQLRRYVQPVDGQSFLHTSRPLRRKREARSRYLRPALARLFPLLARSADRRRACSPPLRRPVWRSSCRSRCKFPAAFRQVRLFR